MIQLSFTCIPSNMNEIEYAYHVRPRQGLIYRLAFPNELVRETLALTCRTKLGQAQLCITCDSTPVPLRVVLPVIICTSITEGV